MNAQDPVVVIGAARTPIGAFLGEMASLSAPELGARAIQAAIARAKAPAGAIDACMMGCVLSAGLGQAPARQAALGAGLPLETGCATINKMCGSGMQAIIYAHDQLMAQSIETVVAGGMESMSNAPYLLDRARAGFRMGHGRALDHMFLDGLEDAYEKGRLMGSFAETCATEYQFTRQLQDAFARASLIRAKTASEDGAFGREIAPVACRQGKTEATIRDDELPRKANGEAIEKMRPAFRSDGTVTAANSSAISDGAAALVLTRMQVAARNGATPLARIVAHATHAGAPDKFPTAPIGAIRKLMDKARWRIEDVDLYEINEAFAVVTMAAMRDLAIPHEKVNIHGGACALGHPIGASGARIVVTLLAALERYDLRRGVAALCIGGGEATAVAIERLN